jgi:ELWxxDGT repeat protein
MIATASRAASRVRHLLFICTAAALTLPLSAEAAAPQLVRNINDAVIPQGSFPVELGSLNGKLLFGATDVPGQGPSLWSTDGTTAGTMRLKTFAGLSGVCSRCGVTAFVKVGARGYFSADDGINGMELWMTDGTAVGTTLVTDLRPGADGGVIDFKGQLGSSLIFGAFDGTTSQMFVTDGTAAGTQPLTTFADPNEALDDAFIVVDGKFYFVAHDSSFARHIWVSDGTAAGTQMLASLPPGNGAFENPRFFRRVSNKVLYVSATLLWTIDIATDVIDAVTVDGAPPGFGPPNVATAAGPIAMSGFILFIAPGNAFGSLELWRSDSTGAGTFKIADIHPGPAPFEAHQFPVFTKVADRVVYIADDGVNGPQLWSSDGTPGAAVRLTNATQPANVPFQIAIPVGTLGPLGYFMMPDGANTTTWSMWRTDGTIPGTRRIVGLPSVDQSTAGGSRIAGDATNVFITLFDDPQSSLWKYEPVLDRLTSLRPSLRYFSGDLWFYDGARLYFADNDRTTGSEPWVSDGTAAGTHLLRDILAQGTADNGSMPNELVVFHDRAVFAADDGVSGRELWISDGTAAGTTLLTDINPGPGNSDPNHLLVADGALYFFARDASGISHFMRLTSTTGQVEPLAVAFPGPPAFGFPRWCERDVPVAFGGKVYFAASADDGLLKLWKSNGTSAGTGPILASDTEGVAPCELTVLGNRLYFTAFGADGKELWKSSGTSAGTVQVADILPGPDSSSPIGLTVFNGLLYFGTWDAQFTSQLWRSDSTAAGTKLVADIGAVPGRAAVPRGIVGDRLLIEVLYPGVEPPQLIDRELWTSGGKGANTSFLTAFSTDGSVDVLISGNRAYYASANMAGSEPWVTDGTVAGTRLLKDLGASAGSTVAWFADFRSVPVFGIDDPAGGGALWRTDGTRAGTTQVGAIPSKPAAFSPIPAILRQRLVVGQKLFFVATDAEIGDELYALANEIPVARTDSATSMKGAAVTVKVLTNDTDADGTLVPRSVRLATNPSHGTVLLNASGTLVYRPAANFSGTDTFSYTVDDNQGATSNAAVVKVMVTAAPLAAVSGKRGGGG